MRGYSIVFIISFICILIGDLDKVSSLLSNFFIATYAIINYSVFHASLNEYPGWRPSFSYYNKWLSLAGTFLCIAVMFFIDYVTSIITIASLLILLAIVRMRRPKVNWGSSLQAESFTNALKSVHTLSNVEDHVKTYRPKIMVLSGNPSDRPALVDFANLLTKNISLLELVHIVNENVNPREMAQMKSCANDWLRANKIKAFFALTRNASFSEGARAAQKINELTSQMPKLFLELSGFGKLSPNTMLLGFPEQWWMVPQNTEVERQGFVHCSLW